VPLHPKTDVWPTLKTVADIQGIPRWTRQVVIPEHVADLYGGGWENCDNSAECQELAQLPVEYSIVFSYRYEDKGLTKVVRHEISLAVRITPIRQPTQRLGPEKEVSIQVQIFSIRTLLSLPKGRGALQWSWSTRRMVAGGSA